MRVGKATRGGKAARVHEVTIVGLAKIVGKGGKRRQGNVKWLCNKRCQRNKSWQGDKRQQGGKSW